MRRVRDVVEVVPGWLKAAFAALVLLSAVLLGGYIYTALRSRRLARQRRELLGEVGLLQTALLPLVPGTIGSVAVSVAYRPSDGPGAGGDFYDAVALPGGRAGFVLGDVSGHGREALSHTAFMRYTLRAYLEAGLEPRVALQVAERVAGEHLGGDFATVILAVHDPRRGTLTYAAAGHPAPIVMGASRHDPVAATSSPPIGWNLPTGLRQTTIPLAAGSRAMLYTDGLEEAPTGNGEILGRDRLTEIAVGCGTDATAPEILDRVVSEASEARDDMAACLIVPTAEVRSEAVRTEQLELFGEDTDADLLTGFLEGCGVAALEAGPVLAKAATQVRIDGGALVTVYLDDDAKRVEVLPREIESIEAASRRPRHASLGEKAGP
ncbi:MAG: serine/threonine-protein phosphatase [Thermoleophilaceae bacterium]|nr:serine/threonine-protein phosphatase [Thermoleophilaceae bacterium]